jgi:hypothetical protein
MRRILLSALVLLWCSAPARAQGTRESWTVGVTGAAGLPAALASVRAGTSLGEHAGIDVAVARLTPGWYDDLSPAVIAQVRWIRGGRSASGDSRYWIFGVLGMQARSSTLVIYPGNVRTYLVDESAVVMPRVGYGWDHISRRGTRFGLELTAGGAGEQAGLMLANVFVMWGPPRR